MRAQTENTPFSCKDDWTLTKHTWRWTYSALRYFFLNTLYVKTETQCDWQLWIMSRPRLILSMSRPRPIKRCLDQDRDWESRFSLLLAIMRADKKYTFLAFMLFPAIAKVVLSCYIQHNAQWDWWRWFGRQNFTMLNYKPDKNIIRRIHFNSLQFSNMSMRLKFKFENVSICSSYKMFNYSFCITFSISNVNPWSKILES